MTVSELKTAKTKDEFNRMAIVTKVGKEGGTDVEERQVAKFMTHSIDVARANYQHLATTEQAVSVYSSLNKQRTETEQPHTKRRKFTDTEAELIKDYTSSHKICPKHPAQTEPVLSSKIIKKKECSQKEVSNKYKTK